MYKCIFFYYPFHLRFGVYRYKCIHEMNTIHEMKIVIYNKWYYIKHNNTYINVKKHALYVN